MGGNNTVMEKRGMYSEHMLALHACEISSMLTPPPHCIRPCIHFIFFHFQMQIHSSYITSCFVYCYFLHDFTFRLQKNCSLQSAVEETVNFLDHLSQNVGP